jgi:hypothetical protein
MTDTLARKQTRRILEQMLAEVVVALREHCGDGNLTLRIPTTGDFVVITQVEDQEAEDLARLLRSNG